ncbi:unnamed protein product [Pieris macdunnoughi]|uniref:Insulin-like domain-containing protein n=1 Tax=Pieris macdunnoughi TaxID=345717 RepID=A0A821VM76_9NEOP|nr:unnamed protein product [Pieris macdunnoughi]
MFLIAKNFHWLCIVFLYGNIISGDSLTLNSMLKELCSRSLSNLIFHVCNGDIMINDFPELDQPKVRSRRAALIYASMRIKRQLVDECCLHPCSVAQLVQYCPTEEW